MLNIKHTNKTNHTNFQKYSRVRRKGNIPRMVTSQRYTLFSPAPPRKVEYRNESNNSVTFPGHACARNQPPWLLGRRYPLATKAVPAVLLELDLWASEKAQ